MMLKFCLLEVLCKLRGTSKFTPPLQQKKFGARPNFFLIFYKKCSEHPELYAELGKYVKKSVYTSAEVADVFRYQFPPL